MRPLAVLILVLGAFAALFFALSSGDVRVPAKTKTTSQRLKLSEQPEESLTTGEPSFEKSPMEFDIERTGSVVESEAKGPFSGFITGQVIDTNNYSVRDASIRLISLPPNALLLDGSLNLLSDERAIEPVAEVKSLADGSFALDEIEPGERWALAVSHPNYTTYVMGPLSVPKEGGLPRQLIVLVPGNSLYGTVSHQDSGAPIAGASLALSSPTAAFLEAERRGAGSSETTSDDQGFYRFLNTDRSVKTLTVRAPGYGTAILSNFIAVPPKKVEKQPFIYRNGRVQTPEEPLNKDVLSIAREFNIKLQSAKSIAGRVLAPDGSGLHDVKLQAFCLTSEQGSHGKAISVAGGEFILEDLSSGQYTIQVEAKEYTCLPIQRVQAGVTDLEIQLVAMGSISGRAINDATGRALGKFSCGVRAHNATNVSWGSLIKTMHFADRGNGSFVIEGIPKGDYVIEVKSRGLASSFSAPFQVVQGKQTKDITIRVTEGGTLRGVVMDKRTGKPIQGAKVITHENNFMNNALILALGNAGNSAASRFEAKTAEDGTFEFKLMTPDTYQLQIEKEGFSVITLNEIKVGDGEETDLPSIVMQPGALLKGYVFDTDGTPAAGATVMLISKDKSNHWGHHTANTDSNGHYLIPNVTAGDYELSATRPSKPGGNFLQGAVDMKQTMREIVLNEGSINVYDLDFSDKKL